MAAEPVYIAGVDAGSHYTRCVICRLQDGCLQLAGYGEVASRGWQKGRLIDQNAVSECILATVHQGEHMAGVPLESIVLGMGGATVSGVNNWGVHAVGHPRHFSQADLAHAVDEAARVMLPEDRMLLHLFPQDFSVDGRPGHRNPRGMIGSRLDAYVHLVTASTQEHRSLLGAAHQAHLAVQETVFEPLAAAYAAVLPEDRREGIAVLDIGAHSTDLVVYYGDALIHAASLPICGDHFTWDIAKGFHVSYEDAESIKRQHGSAVVETTADNSLIEIPSPADRDQREMPRRTLNMILEARARELFTWVQRELVRIAVDQDMMCAILSGGAARLNGMCDTAEQVLNCQARNGLPIGIQDWPQDLNNPSWTTVAGLAMYAARLKLHAESDRRGNGFFNRRR